MTRWGSIAMKTGAAMLLAFSTFGCTSGNENKSSAYNTSETDSDPRNNENATLGAKSMPSQADALPPHDSVDKTEFHYNSRLSMNQVLSERLRARVPEVAAAYVALTESNTYAAVKLNVPRAQGVNRTTVQVPPSMPDGVSGAGLFGQGQGSRLEWHAQDGLTTDLQIRIAAALHELAPGKANIFVSSNPNYVQRMQYYSEQARSGTSMNHFINEFNTMSHYAFPARANASNLGNR